jgi:hypothetical protein
MRSWENLPIQNVRRTIVLRLSGVKLSPERTSPPFVGSSVGYPEKSMSGVAIDHYAWVMAGDGEKTLFFRNEGDAHD